jgi:hopanoid biosynthesis associated radical SAM protein HpnH
MWTVASYVLRQRLAGRKRYPLVLMLEPLFRCNLACAGCGKIQYPAHVLKRQLTPEECFRAADECGAPMVSIPGGEPLLHPQINQIVEGLVARKKYVYLCTNALLLKEKLDQFTPSRYLTFSVHMDGQREHHDFSVCREGGYDIAVEAIKAAVSRGFRVTTNTTLFDGADAQSVREFFDEMMDLGVEGMMLSPGYSYDKAPDQKHFLAREKTRRLFSAILNKPRKRWRFNQSPLFLEFLMGERHYTCTPWGMPTYNVFGWQKPCYLLQDGYAETFAELMESTQWERYGTESGNPRCANCMVHSGYEASAVDDTFGSIKGFLGAVRATVFGIKQSPNRSPVVAEHHAPSQDEAPVQLSVRGQSIEKAFDYRGDVTVTTKGGEVVEGYVFDRSLASSADDGRLQMFRKHDGARISLGYAEVVRLEFTGRDTAEGKSFETWVKKYHERKAAGEKNIRLDPERLD